MLHLFFCLLFIEQRKRVVFGSETDEGENAEYDAMEELKVNDKEDEFKKVFLVKQPHAILQNRVLGL